MESIRNVGAVVLAAGQSRRMGQQKLLMPWGDRVVIEQVVQTLLDAGIHDIVVVTGAAHEAVSAAVIRLEAHGAPHGAVKAVFNPDYEKMEMLVSLQVGMRALNPGCSATLVALGDQPSISAQVIRAVVAAYQDGDARLVVPSFQMRRGHPWLAHRTYWPELLAMTADQTMRDFLDAQKDMIKYVVVDAPEVLEDIDTPEDYRKLKQAHPPKTNQPDDSRQNQ